MEFKLGDRVRFRWSSKVGVVCEVDPLAAAVRMRWDKQVFWVSPLRMQQLVLVQRAGSPIAG